MKVKGEDVQYHLTATDTDYGDEGAITVRLYPFDPSLNPGNVHKAWITPVDDYAPTCEEFDPFGPKNQNVNNECWEGGNAHGFIPANSKTDNFKVKHGPEKYGIIGLRNYHDANMDCRFGPEDWPYPEEYVSGWEYGVIQNGGARDPHFTRREDSADDLPLLIETLGLTSLDIDQFRWTVDEIPKNTQSRHLATSAWIHNFLPYPLSESMAELLANELGRISLRFPCPMEQAISPLTADESTGPFDPRELVTPSSDDRPQIVVSLGEVGLGELTVKKVFDTAGDGPSPDDPPISGWPITLSFAKSVLKSGGGPLPDTISSKETPALWNAINDRFKDKLPEACPSLVAGDTIPDPLIAEGKVVRHTDAGGAVTYCFLLPNKQAVDFYEVEEGLPEGWMTDLPVTARFDVYSELEYEDAKPVIQGHVYPDGAARVEANRVTEHTFANYCTPEPVDFDTKGYWHNKNGMTELNGHPDRDAIIAFVNSLPPYATQSSYFGGCDEPFDGEYSSGAACPAAYNNTDGTSVWAAGTQEAEISQFLVDNNAGSSAEYHREQLAQQLLAFVFNVWINADAPLTYSGGLISGGPVIRHDEMSPGVDSNELMNAALAAWITGANASGVQEQIAGFNEDDSVYIPTTLETCLQRYPIESGN